MMKTIRTNVTVGIADPETSVSEIRGPGDKVIREARVVVKHIPAGEPISLDDADADRILAQFGAYEPRIVLPASRPHL